jgi:Replication protein
LSVYQRKQRRRKRAATSLDTRTRSVKAHLLACLRAIGAEAQAEKLARCCLEFRVLGCANGHVWNPIPLERCGYRLCPDCARWRQSRAFYRVFPAIQELRQRHPEDRWVLITLTAASSDDPLPVVVKRFKRWFAALRRTRHWQRCIRGAVAGFECVYHPGQGWHFHAHILASRAAWWDQADLAETWQRVSMASGRIVDIRAVRDLGAGMAETLKYVMKPTNLLDWGPGQVAQFNALRRMKLRECYGELRGLAGEIDGDGEDQLGREPEELPLLEGGACPACGAELTARWLSRDELCRGLRAAMPEAWSPSTGPTPEAAEGMAGGVGPVDGLGRETSASRNGPAIRGLGWSE